MNARSSQALTALPLLALALVAAPAVAQEVTPAPVTATQTAPTATAPQTVAPPPVVATAPAPSTTSAAPITGGSATAIDPQAAAAAAAEQAERRPATRAARTTPATRVTAPATSTAAAATPPAATAPAPAADTGAAAPTAAATQTAEPASVADEQAAPASAPARDRSIWPWIVAALAVVGIAAGLVTWRRRRAREEAWEETAYTTEPAHAEQVQPEPAAYTAEPVPVAAAAAAPAMLDRGRATAAPLTDAPVATAEEASVASADSDDVEALTAAAPVADRPWLELAMRPVRAGTTDDDARVEIELTVGNAGPVDAEEVHVSAFMLADADDGEIERMLVNPPAADAVEPLRIGAGEGARVDAALTLPRASLQSEARFRPVVIAEARYRLPNGEEGRTAASFDVGMAGDLDAPLAPVTTAGTEMRDDVEARLHRAAEHV